MIKQRSFNQRGFTLIEMTIVIVISSLVLAAALAFIRPYFAQQQLDKTAGAVRTVERALQEFLNENGRYPCPANLKAQRGSIDDGVENCTADGNNVFAVQGVNAAGAPVPASATEGILIGAVPYKALNIPSIASVDAFDNRMSYAVSNPSTRVGAGNFDDDLSDGTLSARVMIVDESGQSIFKRDVGGVLRELPKHYYFYSHGRTAAGAHSFNGVLSGNPCNPAAADGQNCDFLSADNGIFLAAARSEGNTTNYNDDVSNETLRIEAGLNDQYWAQTPTDPDDIYNLNDGNIGVGKDNPRTQLDVDGPIAVSEIFMNSNGPLHGALLGTPTGFTRGVWTSDAAAFIPVNSGDNYTDLRLYIVDNAADRFSIYGNPCAGGGPSPCLNINNASLMATFVANGNVGIGVVEPQERLHIQGGDFVQDLSPPGPQRYLATTGGDGSGQWTTLGMMDNSYGSTGALNDANQYGVRINWDSDRLVMGLENNGSDRKDGVIGMRTGNLDQDSLNFEMDGNKVVTLKADTDDVPYPDGLTRIVPHLGVGLPNPDRILDVNRNIRIRSAGADWWTSLDIWHNTNQPGINPAVTMYRGRGTFESPTGALTDDIIGVFDARGTPSVITPPGHAYGSGMVMRATQNHGNDIMGTDLMLLSVANGDYFARPRIRLYNDKVIVGQDVYNGVPEARLDVRGDIRIGQTADACVTGKAGAVRFNNTADILEYCAYNGGSPQWKPVGGGGFGSTFVNWTGTAQFPSESVNINGLQAGKYFVSVMGRTGDEGGGDSYTLRFNIQGVARNLYVANHPDGTPLYNVTAVVTVDGSGNLEIEDGGSDTAFPNVQAVTAFKISD